MRLGLIAKISLALTTTALLTTVVATMAWLGFSEVVDLQRRIIDDTVPAVETVQAMTQLNTSALALVEQLGQAKSVDELDRLQRNGRERFAQARNLLGRLERQHFESSLLAALSETVDRIAANLGVQAADARSSLQLQSEIRTALFRQHRAVDELMLLAETLAANASTYTTATVASIYPMLERGASKQEVLTSLDRLIEVDVDRMERMSELQLICFRIKTKLERAEGLDDRQAVAALARDFAADLDVLSRRLQDFRDPTRKAKAEQLRTELAAALTPEGLFALRAARLELGNRLALRHSEGDELASRLNEQGGALLQASQQAVERVGEGSRNAIARGALGFLAVGALLLLALLATLWLIFRYDVLDRLKGMEASVRALMAGRYDDVTIRRGRASHDPLAPLVDALEQFREHAIERQRLEQALLQHQQQLEQQVVSRTAELSRSNEMLEREVEQHAQARRDAEEANRAKNEFLGSLSHELRTPLSGVSGSVQLLRDTALDDRQREYVGMIAYANTTLLETLEDMLGFSRLEAGKLSVEHELFSLTEVIDSMLSLQSVAAQAKGLALVRDIASDVPDRIAGDRRKLNQVLLNTIGNAIKFTDEGEVAVKVTLASTTEPGGLRLRFAVSDTGIGIDPAQQEAVFRPFFQVQDNARRHHAGTGLGLAICQRLVALMGGSIGLQSEPCQGTTITFELPVEAAPALVERRDMAPAQEDPITPPALEVLVVEDDEINRIVCQRYLESLGHHVHLAEDGCAALELLRTAQHIDCVLTDISLPGTSGFEVTLAIHAVDEGRWSQLPVIGMSAHVTGETFERQLEVGMVGFLSKPFQRGELSRALASVVGAAAAPSAAAVMPAVEPADTLLDLAYLAEEIDGLGRPVLRQLLDMFQQELDVVSASLQDALRAADPTRLGQLAHKLRSAAGNLGLVRVMADCRRIELAAKEESPTMSEMPPLVSRLAADCKLSVGALEQWLIQSGSHHSASV